MDKKAKYTVITKILGTFIVVWSIVCFRALFDLENEMLAMWSIVYLIFVPIGGILSILDFGQINVSSLACFSYAFSIILRMLFDITISGEMNFGYYLILGVALFISILRYLSVRKVTQGEVKNSVVPLKSDKEEYTYTAGALQSKCRVGIMREARVSGGGSLFTVYVDGVKTTSIKNGGVTRLILDPGRHIIGFGGIGSKILGSITLNMSPGADANIVCYSKLSGIEVVPTSVDVCSLSESVQPTQQQSNEGGCLPQVIGLILFLIGLSILGVRFVFYITPIS